MRTFGVIVMALLGGACIALAQETDSAPTDSVPWAVRGGTLIDGTGAPPVPDSVVTGVGERITCAGSAQVCAVPAGAATVDATGKWLIPGLIDTHVHLYFNSTGGHDQLHRFVLGITATREAGTPDQFERTVSRKKQAEAETSPEPRLVVSGLISPDEMERFHLTKLSDMVEKLASLGADAIKYKFKHSPEELDAIISTAHALNLPVWGHAAASGVKESLDAGIDGLPHLWTFPGSALRAGANRPPMPPGADYWVWESEAWNYLDDARLNAITDEAIARRVWIEPNLVYEKYLTLPFPVPADEAHLTGVPSLRNFVRPWIPIGEQSRIAQRARQRRLAVVFERQCRFVKDFHDRGGIVLAGSDTFEPGLSLIEELRLMTECGLSPMAALQASTKHAALAIRRPALGTVEPGKIADIVLLDANPLSDTTNLRRVWRVMKGGHVYDPAALIAGTVESYRQDLLEARVVRAAAAGVLILCGAWAILICRRLMVSWRS
ncbi:MAG TPA: amidohydrolase family protein [Vicinamibacterales bacterium]|nr:amidohydrolase family protein [Vicinamibacterales bacterium]